MNLMKKRESSIRIQATIVATAIQGFTGLTHLMLGSIAENPLNRTRESVWTYTLDEKLKKQAVTQ